LICGPRLSALKDILQELVSVEHKQIWENIVRKGGIKAVREDDEILNELERTAGETSSVSSAQGQHTRRAREAPNSNVDDLKSDIFEDPDAAAEKNRVVFGRKFDEQQDQIVRRVTAVVNHASDRVVRELSGGPHERIRDKVRIFLQLLAKYKATCFQQSIHEIWKEMARTMFHPSPVPCYRIHEADDLFRAGAGMSKLDISRFPSGTISWRRSLRNMKTPCARMLLKEVPRTQMRGQSDILVPHSCSV
jgi:hypothetical protein